MPRTTESGLPYPRCLGDLLLILSVKKLLLTFKNTEINMKFF